MTTSPTRLEFQATVRDAFGFLVREFGFREVQPRASRREPDAFVVRFANTTTAVQVEGINWGFAAQVVVGEAAAGDQLGTAVPLWAIMKLRRPDLYEEITGSAGQLADIRVYARALREAAVEVLTGDFAVFGDARALVEARAAEYGTSHMQQAREHRHHAAVASAAEAFRAGDFSRVVELLAPHADLLTPAERGRLEYARTRVLGDG
jgi:hypothetical protein